MVLTDAAWRNYTRVKPLSLVEEKHARTIYERRLVLIRPGGHVTRRADGIPTRERLWISLPLSGRKNADLDTERSKEVILTMDESNVGAEAFAFTSTNGLQTRSTNFELERMGGFHD